MSIRPSLPVIVLSHRGPVSFRKDGGGRAVSRGAGGLVTALTGLAGHLDEAVWVCSAVTDEDSAVAREHDGAAVPVLMDADPRLLAEGEDASGPVLDVRMVDVDRSAHEDFYTVVSNPLLWFVQHGLYGLATAPVLTHRDREAFEDGYAAVNATFADAVVAEVQERGGHALVMLHDYHFYLVAQRVRQRCPDVVLSHFVHIPWPGPDGLRILPPDMRERLLQGLLGNDVVAFHTARFARNFLLCAQELLGLPVDLEQMTVRVGDRTVAARSYPISIDIAALEDLSAGEDVAAYARQLERRLLSDGRQLILRVDRTDPSKNIVRGFLAFERLLEKHPEHVGRVTFLALLQPSRQDVSEYADYLARIGAVVARINAAHVRDGSQPVDLRLVEDLPLAVAAYRVCDTLMVNSVADGMNLVAKEAMVVSGRDAVLLLSENTGAHDELGRFALTVHPFDVEQQADALHEALTMPAAQRRDRRGAAAAVVRHNDVGYWLQAQLQDLVDITGLPIKD
jgi:trehalose 6-phosphate synthase